MLKQLHHLREPSMNLYNAMIQLKAMERDRETVLDLLAELLLARPTNGHIAKRLAHLLPESAGELKQALATYAASLP